MALLKPSQNFINLLLLKNKICSYCLLLVGLLSSVFLQAQVRSVIDFNNEWKFFLGNDSLAINPAFNDSRWRTLTLPHDWSIESNFSKDYPATNQGGALPGGIGWYRKTFALPASAKDKNVWIEFDGIYRNSEVWINGHYLGKRPYGYVPFAYDLTTFVRPSPQKNVITIRVDNSQQPDSRWYTGSGIYRDVKLVIKNKTAINENGIYITSQPEPDSTASINIQTLIERGDSKYENFEVRHEILDRSGKVIPDKNYHSNIPMSLLTEETKHVFTARINKPVLWDVSTGYLYTLRTKLYVKGKLVDEVLTKFGIRSFDFDAAKGFSLNGKPLKIKGVCLHHDLGALGAAFNSAAARRQLTILKEMGCNAIRFSHNPPAFAYLDLCDELGFLVIDEAFDMWQKRKNKYDYHLDFKEWHKKDIEAMVLRDRNHPSVFMWSIGNEIREQFDSTGTSIAKELVSIIKDLDPMRPVTCALTENIPEKNFIYQSEALDVLGFNYKLNDYKDLPSRFPGQKFIATETASALATRGVYDLPSDSMRVWPPDSKQPFTNGNADWTVSAYDNAYAYWGATHERSWLAVKNNDFISGCFVWSGFDFLGEPVPYPWPARSSYYGIIDLAGFPKDVYYMYQSEWTNKNVLHLFPHWNWQPGDTVDVWAYYNNADEVELYLNGKSLGKRNRTADQLHVVWRVPFEPGTLRAISQKNGKTVLTREIKTAGKPVKILLETDEKIIHADGKDLSFVKLRVVDQYGTLVPNADNLITFSISGAGIIAGTDNGYQGDTISLKSNKRNCWKGMALAIIQSTGKQARLNDAVGQGNITLKATAEGLTPAVLILKTSH